MSGRHDPVLLEEIRVHLSELKGCDCVRVFAVCLWVPIWLSAVLVHDYFDERSGVSGVDVRTGMVGMEWQVRCSEALAFSMHVERVTSERKRSGNVELSVENKFSYPPLYVHNIPD